MDHQFAAKPDTLSGVEWKLLQHLSTYSDSFSADEVFAHLQEGVSNKENNLLRFRQYFARLKFVGYIIMIPFAFASMGNKATPSYRLTTTGKTILGQY
jgi:hypothetical protein